MQTKQLFFSSEFIIIWRLVDFALPTLTILLHRHCLELKPSQLGEHRRDLLTGIVVVLTWSCVLIRELADWRESSGLRPLWKL